MLPCRSTCTCAFEGCHKTCPRWRAMQEQQHAETARKKEYLRQADEACRVEPMPPLRRVCVLRGFLLISKIKSRTGASKPVPALLL